MLLTIAAFIVTLGVLITVHEYGHYRVAVACGVKVLRFSVGFGKPLLRWQPKGSPTEFVVGAFPLGGYVKMLDEREAPVAPEERHLAFNTQSLRARAAIVAAGPIANLLLADSLAAFAALHPGVQLELDLSPRRVDLLGENFDLAVRMGELPDDNLLVARRLACFSVSLYAALAPMAVRPQHCPHPAGRCRWRGCGYRSWPDQRA